MKDIYQQTLSCASLLLLLVGCSRGPAGFASPEAAASALVDAIERDDSRRIVKVLGAEASPLLSSGDPIADDAARERFLRLYSQSNTILRDNAVAYLTVGTENWPFPIPILRRGEQWEFDAASGEQEIVARRIGRNEIAAILVSLAYVDAQNEYATRPRGQAGLLEYAQRLTSTEGKHDGLYWAAADGEAESPMGPLVGRAQREGYDVAGDGQARTAAPYHGYYYRILKAQGAGATDGAYDYVVDGRMIGGFALLAYPATYGNSGIMTFIVNHRGIVYEKDLGEDTAALAEKIERFDPDASWKPVADPFVAAITMDQ